MPNQLQVLLHYMNEDKSLNKIVGEGKRFMAYAIVKKLKTLKKERILCILANDVTEAEKQKGKKHQIFTTSFDGRACSRRIFEQKLDYIHHNPVSGKRNLVTDFVD